MPSEWLFLFALGIERVAAVFSCPMLHLRSVLRDPLREWLFLFALGVERVAVVFSGPLLHLWFIPCLASDPHSKQRLLIHPPHILLLIGKTF